MELAEVPSHLLVIGGGPIGLEFAQLFRRFGSKVSIVQRSAHLAPTEDVDISTELEKILTEDGIDLYLKAQAQSFSQSPSGDTTLKIKTSSGDLKSLSFSHVLNATGRHPNTNYLNLSAAGIATNERGFITVNSHLETSSTNIYALGDIKGGPAFTHISYDDSRILKHNLITHPEPPPLSIENRLVPMCTFTDPQLARVGLTEKEARDLHPPSTSDKERITVVSMPMSYVARTLELDESRGLMKAVIDRETGLILGFMCLGYEAGELMSTVQMAMMGKVKWHELRDGIFAHPCLAEGLNNLFGMVEE